MTNQNIAEPKNMSTGKRKASRCSWSCILVTIGGFMFPKGSRGTGGSPELS